MKGTVSITILLIIAAVFIVAVLYNFKPAEKLTTGRAVTGGSTDVGRLGFLESCNPNRDRCDVGLVCNLGRDNLYRCLRPA